MTNKEKLQNWFEKEKSTNDLVDVKFFPGNTAQSSIESFAKCVMSAIEAESQNRYEVLAGER